MLDLQFTDIEQDIILISKGHGFTKEFKEKYHKAKDEDLTTLDRLILLHQEYYKWGDRICLYVIYENLLDVCFDFYEYDQETEFRFKSRLKEIMKDGFSGVYKELIDLEHIINNLTSYISNTRVIKNNKDLYELKGKYVEG